MLLTGVVISVSILLLVKVVNYVTPHWSTVGLMEGMLLLCVECLDVIRIPDLSRHDISKDRIKKRIEIMRGGGCL